MEYRLQSIGRAASFLSPLYSILLVLSEKKWGIYCRFSLLQQNPQACLFATKLLGDKKYFLCNKVFIFFYLLQDKDLEHSLAVKFTCKEGRPFIYTFILLFIRSFIHLFIINLFCYQFMY